MEELITVTAPGATETLVARAGMSKIGSAPNCELRINHHEIAGHAANIEVRGNSILFQNRNDFPVFLGQTEVLPGSWLQWEDQTIQLSRSIALQISEIRRTTKGGTEKSVKTRSAAAPGAAQKKLVQLAIIGMCLFGSVFMLTTEDTTVIESTDKFSDLVQELNQKDERGRLTHGELRMRRHLQEAWLTDLRWRDTNPEAVIDFYQLLLNVPEVANAEDGSLEKRVQEFAKSRLESMKVIR